LIESDFHDMEDDWLTGGIGRRSMPWGWTALVAMAFAAGIIWSLVQVHRSTSHRIAVEEEAKALLEKEDQSELAAEMTIETIEKVAQDFLDSRTVEELLRYVRHPDRVKPLLEHYYAEASPVPQRISEFISLDPLTVGGRANFWFVGCMLEDGSRTQMLVEVSSEKVAKVDWESQVCYQPMPWDEFAKRREGGYTGDFRVYAEPDYFFSHEFADSENLACVRLTALNSSEVLYGYVQHGSSVWQQIAEQLEGHGGRPAPMILRLYVPENLESPRGVVIQELVAPRWVFLEDPALAEP
ncbi:MAG: hypothetical protein ABJZ75_02550, partial [Luteolibacter sp.]